MASTTSPSTTTSPNNNDTTNKSNNTICVTGGSGFLASRIVQILLAKGYTVHATTRKLEKALFLQTLDHATETNLRLFAGCDFSIPHSFDDAIRGCYAVIHTASPFYTTGGTRDNLVTPAVEGTEMVLTACRTFDVQYVTLTSSSAAVYVDYGTKAAASESGNHVYTDKDWSPEDVMEEHENYYCLSKTYAEKRAWELSREDGCPYKLCVLNPSLIWGPMTKGQNHLNTSTNGILQYMDGSHTKIQNGIRCVVDIRDVALAHITPITDNIGWNKRYLLFGGAPRFTEVAAYVKKALLANGSVGARTMAASVPVEVEESLMPTVMGPPADTPLLFDCSPAEVELGIKFTSVEVMVKDCVNELLESRFSGSEEYCVGNL